MGIPMTIIAGQILFGALRQRRLEVMQVDNGAEAK
jgi:hypothetical protein